jgi:hypothetical protein
MKKKELSFSREVDRDVYTDMARLPDADNAVIKLKIKLGIPPSSDLEKKIFQDYGYIV